MSASDLTARWRARAAELRELAAAEAAARAFERAADELEGALQDETREVLSLRVAALESGYSTDHLARMVREGKIPNAGRPNAPRIQRRDLPHKASALPPRSEGATLSRTQIARSVVTSTRRHHDG